MGKREFEVPVHARKVGNLPGNVVALVNATPKLSLMGLATDLGYYRDTVRNLVNSPPRAPNPTLLRDISRYFGITVDQLVGRASLPELSRIRARRPESKPAGKRLRGPGSVPSEHPVTGPHVNPEPADDVGEAPAAPADAHTEEVRPQPRGSMRREWIESSVHASEIAEAEAQAALYAALTIALKSAFNAGLSKSDITRVFTVLMSTFD